MRAWLRDVKMSVVNSVALARVGRGDLCAGCGACAGRFPKVIEMQQAGDGWPRPKALAPLTAAQDAELAEFCPGLVQTALPSDRPAHPLWGAFQAMRRAWATDDALRHRAASGGALSAVLGHLLASGRVDAVIQTTAALPPDPAHANRTIVSTGAEDIAAAAGSRYAASSPLTGLTAWVADGRRFAFVGKPCDAAALRALALRDHGVARAFPVILSFFCAGVPSRRGNDALVRAMGAEPDQVTAFRYRGFGWPGQAVAQLADGSERSMGYHESWGGVLSKHLQHRCKICADGTGTAADLSFGDPWETDANGYPLFTDAPGQSLVVIRTALGAEVLAAAEQAGAIESADYDVAGLVKIQPGQRNRRRALLARLLALRLLGRPVPEYRGMTLLAAARQERPLVLVKAFLGMARRAWPGVGPNKARTEA